MSNSNMQDVIVERIEGLKELINEKFEENKCAHMQLQHRVDTTNGRVKKLELWRSFLVGAWMALSGVAVVIGVPLYKAYFEQQINVATQVDSVMQKYIETVKE